MKTYTMNQELKAIVNQYILDAIDGSGYDRELTTDKEKLQFVADCFVSEYCFAQNLKRCGTHQNVFKEWIMGLPSSFNIDFENYKILQIGKAWELLSDNATEEEEDKFLENWFGYIAAKTFRLMSENNVNPYKTQG